MFCGKPASGKSSLFTALLTQHKLHKKKFENVLLCMPMHSFTSMAEESNPFLDLENRLFIIDDYASQMKDANLLRLLLVMINNRRHRFVSIFVSVQTYKSVPLGLRRTVNVCVLFKIHNKAEIKPYMMK